MKTGSERQFRLDDHRPGPQPQTVFDRRPSISAPGRRVIGGSTGFGLRERRILDPGLGSSRLRARSASGGYEGDSGSSLTM